MTSLIDRLADKALFKTDSYIDGQWVGADEGFDVTSPSDRSHIARVSDVGAEGAEAAIAAAAKAFESWKKTSVYERAEIVRRWHDRLFHNQML